MDLVLFGPPGAGKGTQAGRLCEAASVVHVSTGDIFRRHLRSGTELGLLASSYMSAGKLVPDQVVFDIVASRLGEPDAGAGALFDGFPRTVAQAELLEAWLGSRGRRLDLVVNLVVDDGVVVGRLSGRRACVSCGATYHVDFAPTGRPGVCDRCGAEVIQRPDDAEETVRRRLAVYHAETAPVLAWLRARCAVVDVPADLPVDAVGDAVLQALRRS